MEAEIIRIQKGKNWQRKGAEIVHTADQQIIIHPKHFEWNNPLENVGRDFFHKVH